MPKYIIYFILLEKYNKVNVVKYIKLIRDKIAVSYNLMAFVVGGQMMNEDDINPTLNGLKTHAGSTENKNYNDKVSKSYDLMHMITGAR